MSFKVCVNRKGVIEHLFLTKTVSLVFWVVVVTRGVDGLVDYMSLGQRMVIGYFFF